MSPKHPLSVKRAKIENLKIQYENEKAKHLNAIQVSRAMTLNSLKTCLPEVFQALMGYSVAFSLLSYHGKEDVVFSVSVDVDNGMLSFTPEAAAVQEKADASVPATTWSPPEGNTTFVDGTTWCVALAGVSQVDLQIALDWACGPGAADCGPIQVGGSCFDPDTLLSHASYAFNTYYQQNGNSDIACNFGGTAKMTKEDPSYGKCVYAASGLASSAPAMRADRRRDVVMWWNFSSFLFLLYLGG
ncbi:hypothetical protein Nepgr_003275 [Nepenthes gracilis]|uniref:X8 domain-containing protein n=1 Tax=Nepenthes gracilis TaxID=150966 RepID=A0AAD3RZ74_NEPGR|nr:hypothetical protein Nepgr_003275 [Nepenthes gracilis]